MPPKTPAKPPVFDLTLLPGTRSDQKRAADTMLIRGEKPIEIRRVGRQWELVVIGTPIGRIASKRYACSAAHQVGRYRLELGDFVAGYTKGYCKR